MDEFDYEQRMVAETFQTGMLTHQQEPLILYGVGKNTKAVLCLTTGYSFVGLLDPNHIGEAFYGKRVLSLDEVSELSKNIVIIARNAVVPIIFHRIEAFVRENGIHVYNYAGKQLKCDRQNGYEQPESDEWKHSWEELLESIAQHDVISFDVFDTLLGRYVLEPEDLFSLMEREIRGKGNKDVPFQELRRKAEQACGYAASLDRIYEKMEQMGVPREDCAAWYNQECAWEQKLTFARRRMVDALSYAQSQGKRVFLTSDMYLRKSMLEKLLAAHGISGQYDLLISCEEIAEKSDGALFSKLLERTGAKTVLHIGDNQLKDVDMARRMGIDGWHILSGYDLLMRSSLGSLLVEPGKTLGDRLVLGMLCANLFEDPFSLHGTKGRVVLTHPRQIGYSFVGPWTLGIVQWIGAQIEKLEIEQMIYPSRDGFLFYKVGRIMEKMEYMPPVRQIYLKASRRALVTANIRCEEDLKAFFQNRYDFYQSGTKGESLKRWLRIEPEPLDREKDRAANTPEDDFSFAVPYLPQILKAAEWERRNYLNYIRGRGIAEDQKTAIFDFTACGTVQHYFERLLEKELVGLYVATRDHPNDMFPEPGHVFSAFGNVSTYQEGNQLGRVFIALESLLIDGDKTLAYINEDGEPVFFDTDSPTNERALLVQDYACEFVSTFLRLFGNCEMSFAGLDHLIGSLFSRCCGISENLFSVFYHDTASREEIYAIFGEVF